MMPMMMKIAYFKTRRLLPVMVAVASLAATAHAAVPGITGPTFNLTAQPAFLNQPDGSTVYSWGYGCNGAPTGFAPAAITGPSCPSMQVPGPTMIVTEGQTVTVNLTNNLPTPAGNTSILFPGFSVTGTGGVTALMSQEAAPGGTVSYTFVASSPGTHSYYSGTQGDLQIEMGLYGALIVLPASVPTNCTSGLHGQYHRRETLGRERFQAGGGGIRSPCNLLRPRIPVPVRGDGWQYPRPGPGPSNCDPACGNLHHGDSAGLQPRSSHGALPSFVLFDQRSFHAG